MRCAIWARLVCAAVVVCLMGGVCFADPQDQLARGRAAWQAREYASGLAILKEIKDPDSNPEVLQLMGECYKGLKDWPAGIKCFERILAGKTSQFAPQDVRSWIMDCYLANDQPNEAFTRLEKLVAEYPKDAPKFHYLLGRRYQWMHQYAEGAKQLKQALKIPKTDPLAKEIAERYINCSLSAEDSDAALAYLPTFVSDYPDSVSEILSAQLFRWKFKIPSAIQVVEKVMARSSGEAEVQMKMGLADCYAATHDWQKASRLLNSVPGDFQKRSAQWHVVMAKCYWGQNKYTEAVAALNDGLAIQPTNESRKLLMEYYRGIGDYEHLLVTIATLQKEWPENASEWLLNEGWCYLEMKQYEKAAPIFRDAISKFPDQRWIVRGSQVSLAECLYRLGKGPQALADLKAYYSARPDLGCEYQMLYGQVMYFGASDYSAAITSLNKVLDDCATDPLAGDARDFLVRVLMAAGRRDEAAALLQTNMTNLPVWNQWDRGKLYREAADTYFDAKNYKKAAEIYADLAKAKSDPDESRAMAMYKLALCKHELGDQDSASREMENVVKDFPNTAAAREANAQIYVWTHFGGQTKPGH